MMLSLKIQQRVNLKFLVKLKKSGTECLQMLRAVYGDACMSRSRLFEWHKRFSEGKEDFEDDGTRCGRPITSNTHEKINQIREIVEKDQSLSIRTIAQKVDICRETVRKILRNELKMTSSKVCSAGAINVKPNNKNRRWTDRSTRRKRKPKAKAVKDTNANALQGEQCVHQEVDSSSIARPAEPIGPTKVPSPDQNDQQHRLCSSYNDNSVFMQHSVIHPAETTTHNLTSL